MENLQPSGVHEIQAIYKDLPPLDRAREVYLVAMLFRDELGLSIWDYDVEQARAGYARSVGDLVNTSVYGSESAGDVSADDIEDIMVHHINAETGRRWFTYTSYIENAGKEDSFQASLPEAAAITCNLPEKAEHIRDSWKKFLEGYGVTGGAFNANVRAEFVQNKTVWDTAKEDAFLRNVMSTDLQAAVA